MSHEEVANLPRRLWDYAVKAITYILIAVGFVACTFWVIATFNEEHVRLFFYWLMPVLYTAALFGYIIKETRGYWRIRMFWIILGSSFLVHVCACIYVFGWIVTGMNASRFRLCLAAIGVEGAGIFLLLGWGLERFGHSKRSGRHSIRKRQDVPVSEL